MADSLKAKSKSDSVVLPEYWTADEGQASVKVRAKGDSIVGASGYVNLYLSTDGILDGKSEFVVGTKYVDEFKRNETFNFDFDQYVSDPNDPRDLALAPGRYYLVAQAVGGDAGFDLGTQSAYTDSDVEAVSAPDTDVLIDWVSTFLTSTQLEGSVNGEGDGPYNGCRIMAMMSTAAYDIAAADPDTDRQLYSISEALYAQKPQGDNFSAEAAINKAAYNIFREEFSPQADLFKAQYKQSRKEISGTISDESLSQSEQFGAQVAKAMIQSRKDDGTYDDTPYAYPNDPEGFVWLPPATGDAAGQAGGPNRGGVKPFVLPGDSVDDWSCTANQDKLLIEGPDGVIDLRLDYRPDDGDGTNYARQYETARVYGVQQATALTQVAANADQREIGEWYSQDENDSWQPWGLPNYMAMAIAVQEGNTLEENAQFFATLHSAIADATTAAWVDKWTNVIPRPKQVITDYANHSENGGVVSDPLWKSGLNKIVPGQSSPPFPDYVSGHSDIYGSWSAVMEAFYGTDYSYSAGSQTLEGTKRSFDGYTDPVSGIEWSPFKEAAMEAAQSRLFWGVHTPAATGASFITGQNIGHYVMHEEIFGKPLTNASFDGIPDWEPFSAAYTANPILPLLELDDPILGPSSTLGDTDGAS